MFTLLLKTLSMENTFSKYFIMHVYQRAKRKNKNATVIFAEKILNIDKRRCRQRNEKRMFNSALPTANLPSFKKENKKKITFVSFFRFKTLSKKSRLVSQSYLKRNDKNRNIEIRFADCSLGIPVVFYKFGRYLYFSFTQSFHFFLS